MVYYFVFLKYWKDQKGFDNTTPGTKYLGSRQRLFFRYRYQYKNLLQFGVTGEKDAGEQFFSGKQKYGFDFYSFHLFAAKLGRVHALALGDFTVNMGQGLIQWQSIAFSKSADVSTIKRQLSILRPYNSSGEFYFNRGAGITLSIRKDRSNRICFTSKTECEFWCRYTEQRRFYFFIFKFRVS